MEWDQWKGDKTQLYSGRNVLIEKDRVLDRFEKGYLPCGRHVYPFEMPVPADLPPSFMYFDKHNQDDLGRDSGDFFLIEYKLFACLAELSDTNNNYLPTHSSDHVDLRRAGLVIKNLQGPSDLQGKKTIIINNKLAFRRRDPVEVVGHSCFSGAMENSCLINVSLGKDWYLPGENIEVQIAVDNTNGE